MSDPVPDKRLANRQKDPAVTREAGKVVAAFLRANKKCLIEKAWIAGGLLPDRARAWMQGTTDADLAFQEEVWPALVEHAEHMIGEAEKDIGSTENGSSAWSGWHRWLLAKRHPRLFADDVQKLEVTGKDGGPQEHSHSLASKSTEELLALYLQTAKEDDV